MIDRNITSTEYHYLSVSRADLVRMLLIDALRDQVPTGYALSTDPRHMYGNALLALRPLQPTEGTQMVSFIHAINYRSERVGGEVMYRPTLESLRACGDVKGDTTWSTDDTFGTEGRIAVDSAGTGDLVAIVRMVAAQVCASEPFTSFEWRRCAHDDGGKWELFNGERKLQSVWKSGNRYGTLMGTAPSTLAAAKAEAEAAARDTICSEHQERLAGLGEADSQEHADDEDEEPEAPTM